MNVPSINLISTNKYKIVTKQTLRIIFLNSYRIQMVKRDHELRDNDQCREIMAQDPVGITNKKMPEPKLPECHISQSLKRHVTFNPQNRPCDYQ